MRLFAPEPFVSHEVSSDGVITFRYRDASARGVSVSTDALRKPLPMKRDKRGIWAASTPPMPPGIYGYSFIVDDVWVLDPYNVNVRRSLAVPANEIILPAHPPAPWEATAIPHGVVSRHVFTTRIAKNFPEDQSAYVVYTPPGYDPSRKEGYPVLYLLHGFSDAEDGWTATGRAHLLLDSLIHNGQAVPMIAVMPLGYGDLNFLKDGAGSWKNPAAIDANVDLFGKVLLSEVIPAVELDYHVARDREHRAIAGLSMGGLQSVFIGLNRTDTFASIAGFSPALERGRFDVHIPGIEARKAEVRLLVTTCGTDEWLIPCNREFATWAKTKGLPISHTEVQGGHTWIVWRNNLLQLAPLLFRN